MARLLIVDDEAVILIQLKEYLRDMGYEVAGTAVSGEDAVEKARELNPDLILMDIYLAGRKLDGISAAVKIKDEMNIPVIFMTAFGGDQVLERVKNVEPYGFVLKPFQNTELKAAIDVAMIRKDMESRLRESEAKLRSVVDTANEAIITTNNLNQIIFWNRAAHSYFGYTEQEALGRTPRLLFPGKDADYIEPEMERIIASGKSELLGINFEVTGRRKNGSEFPMECSLATWRVNRQVFMTLIGKDITERKKIDQMKSDFVSLVSHQLRTPLAGIMGCVDNMLWGLTGTLSFKQMEYLQVMKEISSRGYRIIANLLNISRLERGVISMDIRPVDLCYVARNAANEHSAAIESKGLKLTVEAPDGQILVLADKDKLFEAISNVVHNASKFTDAGKISVRIFSDDSHGKVKISDTGPGIEPAGMKYLFSRNQILSGNATYKGGCGLGLFISKQFMQLQNGDVDVQSRRGKGAAFTFRIPLA
ncbi:PAS domain S-box protein [bacterium]|nr:PAS domain S-box protein [bacterium]